MEISKLYEKNIDKIWYQWVEVNLISLIAENSGIPTAFFQTNEIGSYIGDLIVGIDPGSTHLGVTLFPSANISAHLFAFEITLPSEKTSIESALSVRKAFRTCLKLAYMGNLSGFPAIIEGPSYGERYGQAKLAEMRITLALEILDSFYGYPRYSPPKSIRKVVFGDGKIVAKEIWKGLILPDAADSLACALAGLKLFA